MIVPPMLRDLGRGARIALETSDREAAARGLRTLYAAGASVVPLAPGLPESERRRRLQTTDCAAILDPSTGATRSLGGTRRDARPSLLVFTSGTTTAARAVVLPWATVQESARRVAEAVGLASDDRWVSPLPLAHVGGIGVLFRCWRAGAEPVLLPDAEPGGLAEALRAGATHASLVGRTLSRLLDESPSFEAPSLRWVMVGGGAVDPGLIERARAAGLPAVTTYGLSEVSSTVTLGRPSEPLSEPGDAGWPLVEDDVRVGAGGTIEVRGPTRMSGYDDGSPQRGGWLDTGDFGRLGADGRLVVLDRRLDRIVSGGENVSPFDVEAVLDALPGVSEACVVGRPDPTWGQRVVAVVRWATEPRPDEVAAACAAGLPVHARPSEVIAWPGPLPRTALGKLMRRRVLTALDDAVSGPVRDPRR